MGLHNAEVKYVNIYGFVVYVKCIVVSKGNS